MYMDVGLDTGDMILKATTEITPDMTTAQLHDKLMVQGADLLLETVQLIEENKAPREKQDDNLAARRFQERQARAVRAGRQVRSGRA